MAERIESDCEKEGSDRVLEGNNWISHAKIFSVSPVKRSQVARQASLSVYKINYKILLVDISPYFYSSNLVNCIIKSKC